MALRGHTKIELTDVNTGEVEIYEDDNMVTNALNSFFWSKGFFVNKYLAERDNNSSDEDWHYRGYTPRQFTAGLLLFDQFIEEDPKNTVPPGGAVMVGRGSDMAYTGDDKTLGSYNINESGRIYNNYGYKYIWDFSTNQGNGEIKSVCLTTMSGGIYGTGNTSDYPNFTVPNDAFKGGFLYGLPCPSDAYNLNFNINTGEVLSLKNADDFNNYFPKYYYKTPPEESIIKTGTIYFKKTRLPVNETSIFDFHTDNLTNRIIEDNIPVYLKGFKDIIPDYTDGTYYYYPYYKITRDEEDNAYFMFNYHTHSSFISNYSSVTKSFKPGDVLCYVWKINLKTLEVGDVITLKNTTGSIITKSAILYGSHNSTNCSTVTASNDKGHLLSKIHIVNDKAIISYTGSDTNYPNIFTAIDLNDQSLIFHFKSIANKDKEDAPPLKWSGEMHYINKNSYVLSNKLYMRASNYSESYYLVLDLKNYTISKYNSNLYINASVTSNMKEVANNILYCFNNNPDNSYLYLKYFPTPLVTINNLPQIITKTTSQTMKVTYTIVDDEYAQLNGL